MSPSFQFVLVSQEAKRCFLPCLMRFYSVKRLELVPLTNETASAASKSITSISVERRVTENDVVFVLLYEDSNGASMIRNLYCD